MAIDEKEYAIGTQFRTSEHGAFLHEITKVRPPSAAGTIYELSVVGINPESVPPIWYTKAALDSHYPYVVPRPATDPVDAAGLVPAGDPASDWSNSVIAELRQLGWTIEPPAEPAPLEMVHNWDGQSCPACGSVWPAANLTHWVEDDCGRCGKELTLVYYLVSMEPPGGGEALARTASGDLIANVKEIRTKLWDLADELESSKQSYWRAVVQSVIDLLPMTLGRE